MKASELIMSLVTYMKENGDFDVKIDLLTENQSNIIEITGNGFYKGVYLIDSDINDLKDFKRNLK